MKTKTAPFLLEIGTEEIPASYIKPAINQFKTFVSDLLKEENIYSDDIKDFATPKRLVLYIENLSVEKPSNTEIIIGPPTKIAFDKENKPTKAAIGFSEKFNLKVKDLKIISNDKGEYISIEKKIPAESITVILSEKLPDIIRNLYFPKRMKWNNSELTFARPIRWFCCLLVNKVVNFNLGDISSNRYTYIYQNSEYIRVKVSSPNEYFKKMQENNMFLDYKKRENFLRSNIEKVSSDYNAFSVDFQQELLQEVNFLVEIPYIFTAEFQKNYLNLPKEVLLASMSKYQRIFGMADNKTKQLISRFVAVTEGKPNDLTAVKKNYRRVLESRLQDSLFFFQNDTQTKLRNKIDDLKNVVYHQKLGTVYEKVERILKLSKYVANEIHLREAEREFLKDAVLLSKADLTTFMVGEFPSLQGVMGRIYSKLDGENKKVSEAIYEHYLPRFSGDNLPKGYIGAIISVADRLDSIVGYFGIDIIPTGSYDPYGLRRDIYAIINTLIFHKFNVNIEKLIFENIKLYKKKFQKTENKIVSEIKDFITDRLKILFSDNFDNKQLIDAVLNIDLNDIFETYEKVLVLTDINSEDYFLKAAKVSERTKKIYQSVEDNIPKTVNTGLFKESDEKNLWAAYISNKQKLNDLIESKSYKKATEIYGNVFYKKLHRFFDKVMVNVDNKALRCNRLAMCKNIYEIYNLRVADLSSIKFEEAL